MSGPGWVLNEDDVPFMYNGQTKIAPNQSLDRYVTV